LGRKNAKFAQTTDIVGFFIRAQAFRDPLHGELPHVQIFMNDDQNRSREMPSFLAIDLAEIRRSSKTSSWI